MSLFPERRNRPARRPVAAVPPAVAMLALVATLSVAAMPCRAAVPTPDPVATMQRLAGQLDLQTRMPGDRDPQHDRTPSDFKLHIPGATTILWIALFIGLAFAVYALFDQLPRARRRRSAEAGDAVDGAEVEAVARMAVAGDDADELARLGRIAEAMHLLLLRALTELRARLGITLADSLTSREILGRIALPDDGRRALSELIGRVERVHFGAKSATLDDYGACRGTYERLVGAMLAPPAMSTA